MMSNSFFYSLVIFLSLIFCIRPASAAPASFEGVCYDSEALAFNAFRNQFPLVNFALAEPDKYFLASASLSGLVITSTITHGPYTTGVNHNHAGTITLRACTDTNSGLIDSFPLQDIAFVIALIFCWAIGFKTGVTR